MDGITPEPTPEMSAGEALELWLEVNRRGGYVYFEKLESLALLLADRVDALGARLAPIEALAAQPPVVVELAARLEQDPAYHASVARGLADVEAGRTMPLAELEARLAAPAERMAPERA